MSIGRLQAALAAATNEVTVAAANINFDFTVVKYEAPKEYQPLGGLLSLNRKRDAESGTAHITARRLGALFECVCPETPNLVAAYGRRVSQIADSATHENSKDYSNSVFAAYSGVDATSIWAAATSSRAALPVHLLGCMLARVFEAPEAISIWVELVRERRQNIADRLESGERLPFSLAAAAAQQDISRSQLAEWDASARAWLRTADSIKEREQTQLRLVLENIDLPVNGKTAVYASVIDSWKSALETMENLVSGMPQAVHNGAAVLGLSAWHLYPDMAVFGSKNVEISMGDELVGAGGVLSLGLSQYAKGAVPGVYWCLSLSNMRYYGHPVRSYQNLSVDPKRITFAQFQLAILGTILGSQKIAVDDTTTSINILLKMSKMIQERYNLRRNDRWVDMIVEPAAAYFNAKGLEKEVNSRLINLGRRRAQDFIPPKDSFIELPYFGISHTPTLLNCLKDDEARTSLLSRVAARVPELSNQTTILRYSDKKMLCASCLEGHTNLDEESEYGESGDHSVPDFEMAGYASHKQEEDNSHTQTDILGPGLYTEREDVEIQIFKFATLFHGAPAFVGETQSFDQVRSEASHHNCLSTEGQPSAIEFEYIDVAPGIRKTKMETFLHGQRFEFLFGDPDSVAIFIKQDLSTPRVIQNPPEVTGDDLLWCLESGLLEIEKLEARLTDLGSPIYRMLLHLTIIAQIYVSLPSATISVGSLGRSLECAHATDNFFRQVEPSAFQKFDYYPDFTMIDRRVALGLVAYLEGGHNIPRRQLDSVIAISAGDSIYVPKQLLCDPFQPCQSYELERILGNVGKPGVVMLLSPNVSPMVRDLDLGSWRVSSNEKFNGQAEDCFTGTSLHLSFTEFHVPYFESDSRGQQDAQLSILESVISIRDAGVWVADVDVLRALQEGPIYRIPALPPCDHPRDSAPVSRLISVGCWEDVLDYPDGVAVVKAKGNAIARLAVTTLLAQHPKRPANRISICPPNICWKCVQQEHDFNIYIY